MAQESLLACILLLLTFSVEAAEHLSPTRADQYAAFADITRRIDDAATRLSDTRNRFLSAIMLTHNDSCAACEDFVGDIFEVAWNASLRKDAIKVLDDLCQMVYVDEKQQRICKIIAEAVLIALDLVHLGVEKLGWDPIRVTCSDILQFCFTNCCLTEYSPEQVMLSFADENPAREGTAMTVTWTTLKETPNSRVQWRKKGSGEPWSDNEGTTKTYRYGGWIGVVHGGVMSNLALDTAYEYRVGCDSFGWSQIFSFQTLPLSIGTKERPLRVLHIGDMGAQKDSDDTVRGIAELVNSGQVDFILHVGDLAYEDGVTGVWDAYARKISPFASKVPYMTCPGNHEFWYNFTAYKTRYWMPSEAGSDVMYYSFVVGPVAFLMMDSETPFLTADLDKEQLLWAARVMSKYRSERKFLVLSHHRPLYCTSNIIDCDLCTAVLRAQAEGLYQYYDAGMVTFGHMHNYERMWPVTSGVVTGKNYTFPTSPVYVVNGAAGNPEGQTEFWATKDYTAMRSKEVGFMTMQFASKNSVMTAVSKFIRSRDGNIIDTFTVEKRH